MYVYAYVLEQHRKSMEQFPLEFQFYLSIFKKLNSFTQITVEFTH